MAVDSDDFPKANLGSPDSQYGFSSTPTIDGGPYTVLDPRSSGGITTCPTGMTGADIGEGGFYSWGPPPPYASNRNSANNSPARRSLGELLHHVSPIRRNDNVSPAGPAHHVHRHHVHHSRPCGASPRQMVANPLPPNDPIPKDISTRNHSTITRQQPSLPEMEQSWTNNFSTPHRFPKVVQNKDDYENMYEQENIPPSIGFNTLPSLKKRNQVRVSDFFQNEASPAYIFSSAENLGCSTSNIPAANQFQNKNLPPRIFLSNGHQPNTSTYNPIGVTASQSYESKNQSDSNLLSSTIQNLPSGLEESDGLSASRPLCTLDRNTSLVTKLFVNYSPTKEKAKNSQVPPTYSVGKKGNLRPMQTQRKKISKKLEPPPNYRDGDPNENIITFHYRVGIPRSPNIQNFNQFSTSEGGPGSIGQVEYRKDGCAAENWPKEKTTDIQKIEGNKAPKCMTYVSKEVELLETHNTLIKEFNKNLDVRKNLRSKDARKPKGIENEGFQQSEDHSREIVKPYSKNVHGNLRYNTNSHSPKNEDARLNKVPPMSKEAESKEELVKSNSKVSGNESDVYFGDISNSSCYMSVQNDEPDSLIYEETSVNCTSESKKSNSFQPILNKQHLKMMETQNQGYQELMQEYKPCFDVKQQHSENISFNRRQNLESFQCGYRQTRGNNQYREPNKELTADEFRGRPLHQEPKPQRWPYTGPIHLDGEKDNKGKYYTPIGGESLQNLYLNSDHHESITSMDEQSLSSLTADSGISSGKNFINNCFENTYQELDYSSRDKDHAVTLGPQKLGEQISQFKTEINSGFGNFAHPLFQKPKILPRGNRFKDSELHEIKMLGEDETKRGNDLENGGSRILGDLTKMKSVEKSDEVSNQLLNTCSLTLNNDADLFLEDGLQFDVQEEILSAQKENYEEANRKLPKPLPRTSVLSKNAPEQSSKIFKYPQNKEKISHFTTASDAQY